MNDKSDRPSRLHYLPNGELCLLRLFDVRIGGRGYDDMTPEERKINQRIMSEALDYRAYEHPIVWPVGMIPIKEGE